MGRYVQSHLSMSRKEAFCRSDRYSRIVEKLDRLIQSSRPVYSSYLADQLGVSDRTPPVGRTGFDRHVPSSLRTDEKAIDISRKASAWGGQREERGIGLRVLASERLCARV